MFCKKCGTENLDDALFCKECGRKLVENKETNNLEDTVLCGKCNTYNPKEATFCKECGTKLEPEVNSNENLDVKQEDIIAKDTIIEINEGSAKYEEAIESPALEQEKEEKKDDEKTKVVTEADIDKTVVEKSSDYVQIKTTSLIKWLAISVGVLALIIIIGIFYIIGNKDKKADNQEQKPIEDIISTVEEKSQLNSDYDGAVKQEEPTDVEEDKGNHETEYSADQCSDITNLKKSIMETCLRTREIIYDVSDKYIDKSKSINLSEEDIISDEAGDGGLFHIESGEYYLFTLEGIEHFQDYYEYLSHNYTESAVYELMNERAVIPSLDEETFTERLFIKKIEDIDTDEKSYDYDLYVYKNGINEYEISAYPITEGDSDNFYNVKCYYEDGALKFDNIIFVKTLTENSKITVKSYYDDITGLLYSNEQINPSKIQEGIQVNSNLVNVRVRPEMESISLGKAMKGECYSVLSEENGWFKVSFDNREGYINADFVSLINSGIVEEEEEPEVDEEMICGLAREYYKRANGEAPPLVSVDHRNGDELALHLYEIMEYDDYPDENHASTWGWYYIDVNTLKGTDFFGMPVDLNEVR